MKRKIFVLGTLFLQASVVHSGLVEEKHSLKLSEATVKVKRLFKQKSFVYEIGSLDLENGAIGFINGINNTLKKAQQHALRLSNYAGGTKISHVYNATHSAPIDIAECVLGHYGIETPPVQILQEQWEDFIENYPPDSKFFQICHSQGAIHVKNALLASPKSVRDRIIVLAIAPATIIPKDLCCYSTNYSSLGDFVSLLDIEGYELYSEELILLEPHPNAPSWDHDFDSPTFQPILQAYIANYLNNCRQNLHKTSI